MEKKEELKENIAKLLGELEEIEKLDKEQLALKKKQDIIEKKKQDRINDINKLDKFNLTNFHIFVVEMEYGTHYESSNKVALAYFNNKPDAKELADYLEQHYSLLNNYDFINYTIDRIDNKSKTIYSLIKDHKILDE